MGARYGQWWSHRPRWARWARAAQPLVPVSTRFTGPEALEVIGRSGARALFVAGDFLGVDRLGAQPPGRRRPRI